MPRQANGNYLPPANTAAIPGGTISSTAFNTLETDIGTEITNSVDRGGRSSMTAALPMGGQKIVGMADPTVATDGATKNYVDTATAAFFSTGDVKLTLKNAPDSGWLLFDDGTFGSASSGSSNSNSASNQALFTLFFNNLSDTAAPILTSGGGATTRAAQTNASSAWAANCRMSLPKTLGRALGIAGSGSGLTARALGVNVGQETVVLNSLHIPTLTSTNASQTITVTVSASNVITGTGLTSSNAGPGSHGGVDGVGFAGSLSGSTSNSISTTYTNASPSAFTIMQPTVFLNAMVKQ